MDGITVINNAIIAVYPVLLDLLTFIIVPTPFHIVIMHTNWAIVSRDLIIESSLNK